MSNPKEQNVQDYTQFDADSTIDSEIQEYIRLMGSDISGQTSKILVGKALLPKGQSIGTPNADVLPGGELNRLVLIPSEAQPTLGQRTMEGNLSDYRPCNDAEYIEGKMHIIDSNCVSTPFHGMSFYLGKSDDTIDGGSNDTIVSFEPDSTGDTELHVGGVLWVQDFNLNQPTLAKITLKGRDYLADVTPEKHVGLVFHSPDEATVFSAQGTTHVALAYLPKPEEITEGEQKTFGLNRPEDSHSNLSCNVGQIKEPVNYTHIPKEMLENFLVISFVVILTVSRKMGTVTRHSERPKND